MISVIDRLSPKFSFVLASASPRRRQLLSEMGLEFEVAPQKTPELVRDKKYLQDIVVATYEKLDAYPLKKENCIIIACDTIVVHKGRVYGKPQNEAEARKFLQTLSGEMHQVFSCIVLKATTDKKTKYYQAIESTKVYFRDLESAEIEAYIRTAEPYDKAGGYAVQSGMMGFVKKMNGCYYNVIGLPLTAMLNLLHKIEGDWKNGLI